MGFRDKIKNVDISAADIMSSVINQLSSDINDIKKKLINNVVIIMGGAGGTGTTTLAANISYMLSKAKLRVALLDLNIMYPAQHNYFRIKQEIKKNDIIELLYGKCNIGDAIELVEGNNIGIMYANNRDIMDYIKSEESLSIKNYKEVITELRGLFDIVIIDCPYSVEHALINTAMYDCDSIYMVWDEGMNSISNTERIRRAMFDTGIDSYSKMRVILNKRTNIQYSNAPFNRLGIELVEILPFDTDIIECGLRMSLFCKSAYSSKNTAAEWYKGITKCCGVIIKNCGYVSG